MGNEFREYIDLLAAKIFAAHPPEEGDYVGEDGLIRCGRCHTPRQCRIQGSEVLYPCVCACRLEKREREANERRAAQYRHECFSSPEQHLATFENDKGYDPRLTRIMKNYVAHFEDLRHDGTGILLYGQFGTGKSFHAYQVANALIDRLYRVKVTQFEELFRAEPIDKAGKNGFFKSLSSYALVVLDDLGAEKKSSAMQAFVFTVIDTLYRAKTPFIITTNLSLSEMRAPQDKENFRIYERIFERCPSPIAVERPGGSIRAMLSAEQRGTYQSLLEI